jgi:prolyl-tRNA synthetase
MSRKNSSLKITKMGCYGIGISRMIAAIAQVSHDQTGIIWPESVAPWKCIVLQGRKTTEGEPLYDAVASILGADNVLLDDRSSSGLKTKQQEAERIGYPYIVMLKPGSETNDKSIVINRLSGSITELSNSELSDRKFWRMDKLE